MIFKRLLHKIRFFCWKILHGEETAQAMCFFSSPDAPWNKEKRD